jgi:hypothetical protein
MGLRKFILNFASKHTEFIVLDLCPPLEYRKASKVCGFLVREKAALERVRWNEDVRGYVYRLSTAAKSPATNAGSS